ncbi:MAG: hypothetical protein RR356_05750 [Bacteroidales bacterium]
MNKKNKLGYYKWNFGDRSDGWRVKKVDVMFRMIPYFLRTRMDSQNFFEERVSLDIIETFVKEHKEEIPDLSIMHVIITALVRTISQRPYLNRFVVWNKIFARNNISFAIAIKRNLTDDGEETMIKPYFLPTDTLQDVVNKINKELENSQPQGKCNDVDFVSKILGKLPDFLLRFVVFMLFWMDKVGILPKSLIRISPWHSSAFLTNIGSLGIESIYHHLYEFGTCSMFVAMGKKTKEYTTDKDGEVKTLKSMLLKFVLDERICDGFYYASSMRLLNKTLLDPAILLNPPEKVVVDDGVNKKRADK